MLPLLIAASKAALPTSINDARAFWLGCIGIRSDGSQILSKNGAVYSTSISNYQLIPDAHAECRAIKKMDCGGVMYVARVRKIDRSLAMASPCEICRVKIRSRRINKVYYTVNQHQYGIWFVKKNIDVIYNCGS
jgi:cytidine deaminase